MSSLSFPDVNVWLAVLMQEHLHRQQARAWWKASRPGTVAFSRFTQVSVLRLLTTAAAMRNRPMSMQEAWSAVDGLYLQDDRVTLLPEPLHLERSFRKYTDSQHSSPKLWADAYLLAFAEESGGSVITFDRALAQRSPHCQLLDA